MSDKKPYVPDVSITETNGNYNPDVNRPSADLGMPHANPTLQAELMMLEANPDITAIIPYNGRNYISYDKTTGELLAMITDMTTSSGDPKQSNMLGDTVHSFFGTAFAAQKPQVAGIIDTAYIQQPGMFAWIPYAEKLLHDGIPSFRYVVQHNDLPSGELLQGADMCSLIFNVIHRLGAKGEEIFDVQPYLVQTSSTDQRRSLSKYLEGADNVNRRYMKLSPADCQEILMLGLQKVLDQKKPKQ